jgi:hypothetical protein
MAHCDMAERLTDVVLPIVAGWLHAMVPLNIKRLGPQVDGSPSVAQTGVDLDQQMNSTRARGQDTDEAKKKAIRSIQPSSIRCKVSPEKTGRYKFLIHCGDGEDGSASLDF